MKRHAVHMQESKEKAWQSARRWKNSTPVVLCISAEYLYEKTGTKFGITENNVWCAEKIPTEYISEVLFK